ncbi:hypothetical protein ABN098_18990 [Proteus terrae]
MQRGRGTVTVVESPARDRLHALRSPSMLFCLLAADLVTTTACGC